MRYEQIGRMRGEERTGGEHRGDQSLREDWMEQFRRRIDAFDVDTVKTVSRRLVGIYDLDINGYEYQRRNDLIHKTESEIELGKILESWVKGSIRWVFGVGVKERVDFMRKLEKNGQEIVTMKSDFIKSTGINLIVSNIGTDQYKAVTKAIDFSRIGVYVKNNLYKESDDVLKEGIKLHLTNKNEEYSTAFKATYEWLLRGVSDGGVAFEGDKIRFLSGLMEKLEQEGNYNPVPPIKFRNLKKA